MKPWKSWIKWTAPILAAIVVVAAAAIWWFSASASPTSGGAGDGSSEDVAPVASVEVAPIRLTALVEPVVAYGSIVAPPGSVRTIAVAFEAHVTQVLVGPGQHVSAGEPLLRIEPSAATRLQLEEAKAAVSAAKETLNQVTQQYQNKLATNQDLFTARNAMAMADARLQNIQSTGAEQTRQLTAKADGIISRIDARPGQLVAAGVPMIEIAGVHSIALKLEEEPEDLPDLHLGQEVDLQPIYADQSKPVKGKVSLIGHAVNADTRLVDVFVSLPPDSHMLLGQYVKGTFMRASPVGLTVPRQAVLPSGNEYVLFTIDKGRAVERKVKIVFETDDAVQIQGADLQAGQQAVVVGNYELADGMAVRASDSKITYQSAAGPTTADAGPWRHIP